MVKQGGLGRGLASLIPGKKTKNEPAPGANYFGAQSGQNSDFQPRRLADSQLQNDDNIHFEEKVGASTKDRIIEIPISAISPNPHQPRTDFNEERLQELADSIKEHGVIQPLLVSSKDAGGFELIAGERRLEASKIAGLEKVPAIVRLATEQNKAELSLIENIQRHNLNVVEEAKAYKKMQDSFGLTQDEIASRVGKSRSGVANTMRLLNLPVEILTALKEGKISEGHARTILAVSNPEKQRALFELILKENLNVRQTEDKVREVVVKKHSRVLRNVDPETQQQENELSEALGTKVRLKKSKSGGQVVIDCYSNEELNSIIAKLISLS